MWWRSQAPAAGKRKHIRRARSSWMRSSLVAVVWGDDVEGFEMGLVVLSSGEVGGVCCSSSSLPSSMMVSEL